MAQSFLLKNFSSLNFRILNIITVSYRFAHIFKITPFRAPPQPVLVLRSVSTDVIEVTYIRCLNGRVPEDFELWVLAGDGVNPMTMSPTNQMMKVLGPGSLPVIAFLHVLNYPLIV